MKDKCLVSVIMPVYNFQEYVEKAIFSIINQTYKNIEIICIDDASSDSSYDICKRLSDKFENIVLLRHLKNGCPLSYNLGQEATRNLGLKKMKGQYFMFLDSDDTLETETIERMVERGENTSVDVVMCGYSEVRDNKKYNVLAKIKSGAYLSKEIAKYALDKISWEIISCIGSKLYRTSFIRENGIIFYKKYKYNEDAAFFLEALLHGKILLY